jgi:hypothetical protein
MIRKFSGIVCCQKTDRKYHAHPGTKPVKIAVYGFARKFVGLNCQAQQGVDGKSCNFRIVRISIASFALLPETEIGTLR